MVEMVAPICFGAVTAFSMDSDRCGACAHKDKCAEQVAVAIAEISKVVDVEGLLEKHRALQKRRRKAPGESDSRRKLKTQALAEPVKPAVERETNEGEGVGQGEAESIVAGLFNGLTVPQLRGRLAADQNPFDFKAQKPQWAICEVLRRGKETVETYAAVLRHVGVSEGASQAVMSKLITMGVFNLNNDRVELFKKDNE